MRFAEIQHLPLDHFATGAALILNDIPIAMLFAVFEASVVSWEHDADHVSWAVRAAGDIAHGKRAELEDGRGANGAAQEEAIAAAGLAAAVRDYARLEAACLLVTLAIDRHRTRYQDPLIARSSQLFTALTGNSFACLALDYRDDDVLTLVAGRADGSRVPIAGLSEGELDQLYLALRLAALGEFATRADPLPFICDDLLVSFDPSARVLRSTSLRKLAQRNK